MTWLKSNKYLVLFYLPPCVIGLLIGVAIAFIFF